MQTGLCLKSARRRLQGCGKNIVVAYALHRGDRVDSAAPGVTKQPYLGGHCFPGSAWEGARKGALNKCSPQTKWKVVTAAASASL